MNNIGARKMATEKLGRHEEGVKVLPVAKQTFNPDSNGKKVRVAYLNTL